MENEMLGEKSGFRILRGEGGFVLVFSLVMLVVITMLGVWSLDTSTIEILIAGNEQEFEKDFNISEGAVASESVKIGFARQPWYQIASPRTRGQQLVPPLGTAAFDPGQDILAADEPVLLAQIIDGNSTMWPAENLISDITVGNATYDYRYLSTYVGLGGPRPGTGVGTGISSFDFRMNSDRVVEIEIGGYTLGPTPP